MSCSTTILLLSLFLLVFYLNGTIHLFFRYLFYLHSNNSLFSFTVQLSCVPLEPLRMSLRMTRAVHGGRSSSRTRFSFTDTKGASSGVMASLSKLTKRDYREERERLQTFRRPKNKATSKERTKSLKKGR